jgi:HrpA-like RNA helicase
MNYCQPSREIEANSSKGSGKTTQIPQFLLFDEQPQIKGRQIACTQPRRVRITRFLV